MGNVYFVADTHFFHEGRMKQYPSFPFHGLDTPEQYDQWLMNCWNRVVMPDDQVYIAGDMAYGTSDQISKLLEHLHGVKYLVTGNHDEAVVPFSGYFERVDRIMDLQFSPSSYSFLQEEFLLSLCHYPIVSWNKKKKGACMVHGHCHGRIDEYNSNTNELRVDVGINATLSRSVDVFISLEQLYNHFKKVTSGKTFEEYIKENKSRFII